MEFADIEVAFLLYTRGFLLSIDIDDRRFSIDDRKARKPSAGKSQSLAEEHNAEGTSCAERRTTVIFNRQSSIGP
jgi:hypothetical protein